MSANNTTAGSRSASEPSRSPFPAIARGGAAVLGSLLFFGVLGLGGVYLYNNSRESERDSASKSPPSATKTLHYWTGLREQVEEMMATVATERRQGLALSRAAEGIDHLNADGVDPEAVECGRAFSEALRSLTRKREWFGSNGGAFVRRGLPGARDDARAVAKRLRQHFGPLDSRMRRIRATLAARYRLVFPCHIPPVAVALEPFVFSKGYHLLVSNTSDFEPVSVRLILTDIHERSKELRLGTLPPDACIRLDLSRDSWTRVPGATVTVETTGYRKSYDIDELLPR